MKLVIQRVDKANIKVNSEKISEIKKGYLVLVGINNTDTKSEADYLVNKLVNLRLFEDKNDKLNLSLKDVNGELLLASQFTLYADCSHGNRPSFKEAAKAAYAKDIYDYFVKQCKNILPVVKEGIFGSTMEISLINNGPVTIIIEK